MQAISPAMPTVILPSSITKEEQETIIYFLNIVLKYSKTIFLEILHFL